MNKNKWIKHVQPLQTKFLENHHWITTLDIQYENRWDIAGLWVNNNTDEPCDQNPCQICKQLSNLGITI